MRIAITLPLFTDTPHRSVQYAEVEAAVDVEDDGEGGWEVSDCYVYDLNRSVMAKVSEERLAKLIKRHAVQQCFDHIDDAYRAAFGLPLADDNAEHRMAPHQFI